MFLNKDDQVINSIFVTKNDVFVYPDAPVIEGYEFIGWDKQISQVTEDTTIRANYKKITYTVKFYDINNNVISTQTIDYNQSAIAPNLDDLENFEFVGWDKEFTNVEEDLVVTGQYEAIYYTVTFIDMYGDVIEIKSVQSHTEVEAPLAPTVDYHTFDKWNQKLDNITDDLTVQAVYKFNNKIYDIKDVNYWLQILSKKNNINKPLLNADGINVFNSKVTSDYSTTKVVDLLKISNTETYSNVYSLITKY